jgi:hypothetical protein
MHDENSKTKLKPKVMNEYWWLIWATQSHLPLKMDLMME